jgi:AcrR family transcriptional regulator
MEEKIDRRVKYTKMVLKQSLLELMKEKPIGKITVTDICRMADINRNTFYVHYASPADLLSQIQDELFLEIRRSIEKISSRETVAGLLTEICRAIAYNGELCKIIISEHGDKAFLGRVLNIARAESIAEWDKRKKGTSSEVLDMMYVFTASGSIAIIEKWLRGGMEEPPEQIADFINNMTNYGQAAYLKS